jgi:hypothetical protein
VVCQFINVNGNSLDKAGRQMFHKEVFDEEVFDEEVFDEEVFDELMLVPWLYC